MTTLTKIFIGVDVSKKSLDIHLNPLNKGFRIENSKKGIESLLKIFKAYDIEQIVCEASGGYEFLLCKVLTEAGYKIWCVEPKRIRAFIISEGQKVKTDKIDAKMLALFASQKQRAYTPINTNPVLLELSALIKCRASLVEQLKIFKTYLKSPIFDYYCSKIYKENIFNIENQIKKLDKQIKSLTEKDENLLQRIKIMMTMKGVGFTIAVTLAAEMPELGYIENNAAAALLGVAPYVRQSGNYEGKRAICGGREMPRRVMYMGALSASYSDSKFGRIYKKLRNGGKEAKVAITAIMRKMIVILNTLLRKNEMWNPAM